MTSEADFPLPRPNRGDVAWRWATFVAALATIPAFYLALAATDDRLTFLGRSLYALAAIVICLQLTFAARVSRFGPQFFRRHWLNMLLAIGAVASLFGSQGDWSAIEWVLRTLLVLLVMVRVVTSLRKLFSPSSVVFAIGLGAAMLATAGAGFYWLEPTVTTYADGLWLAFVSGSSVGYGDLVPTTIASRIFAGFTVLLGYALMSLVTASIVAIFVGEDEEALRREMHHDIKQLREEVAALRSTLLGERPGRRDKRGMGRRGRKSAASGKLPYKG